MMYQAGHEMRSDKLVLPRTRTELLERLWRDGPDLIDFQGFIHHCSGSGSGHVAGYARQAPPDRPRRHRAIR